MVSFGGPEKTEDVLPFLRNVTRGKDIPDERLAEVGEHYYQFGGRSPINDQCRALLAGIRDDFAGAGLDLPVYWGNRNWHPYLTDTVREMYADGVRRALVFFTSAYASYSSCRQYRENLAHAIAEAQADDLTLVRLPHHYQRTGFLLPFVDRTAEAIAELPAGSRLVFVTHSIPTAMNDASGPASVGGGRYVAEHLEAAAWISERVSESLTAASGRSIDQRWDLVYCSRSGPPSQPWLEPDVNDHLEKLAGDGVPGVALIPLGFVSDHMEVIYDLDTEAMQTAERLGMAARRIPTPGTDPRYVRLFRELVSEQLDEQAGVPEPPAASSAEVIGRPVWTNCPVDCCRNLRGDRPVACSG